MDKFIHLFDYFQVQDYNNHQINLSFGRIKSDPFWILVKAGLSPAKKLAGTFIPEKKVLEDK
jgi:hypothetical protein